LPRSTRRSTTRSSALVALLLTLLLAMVGCGDSSGSTDKNAGGSAASGDWPVTVSGDNGELTLEEQPDTIVSLSASATEMLFAIGAGDQVEAVDNTSNYPTDAPVTDLSAFTPNAEAIAAYSPDLVVLSDDMNGVIDALGALKVPVLQLGAAATLDDSYEQLATLGDATGHADKASEVTADMRERIADAVASVPAPAKGTGKGKRVYHELDPTFYSVASTTFIGGMYSLFGLENIADGAADASGGYPQLSAEYVVGQAPDLIVLADTVCCAQSAETLAQRPAFDTVPAVKEGRVLEANDDIASRWGPRVADFAESVAETLRG
jgi:ABC-type Fe3+-hydroxamate transport system substrate-binding protein